MYKSKIFTFLAILFLAFLGLSQLTPPAAVSAIAPLVEFSSSRAMGYLEAIAQKPHPIGSLEHTKVRDYIFNELTALKLTPQIQTTTVINPKWGTPFVAGTIHNLIAKLPGTHNTKAVLVVAHYDSVPNGSGASDDGVAVAAMLETLRALKVGSPLKNDAIFLFSDGEEPGLLGAKAFADEHSWAKEIGAVLNFEARGNRGASLMFETGSNNGGLIQEFAKAVPHPVASSLFSSIYKLLPNDTDFTIFKQAGISGLNFAFIDGLIHYHTQSDNLANVSDRSLQHHGETMLALTRRLGNVDLGQIHKPDAVFFNLIEPIFIHYSEQWVIPLSIFVTLLFAGVVRVGFKQKQLTLRRIVAGFGVLLSSMVSAAIAVSFVWWSIGLIHSEYQSIPQGDTYNSIFYLIAFVFLTIALTALWYNYAKKRTSIQNLCVGAMLWWWMAMILTSVFLPGASYLFTWPLLFSLMGLVFIFASKHQKNYVLEKHFVVLFLFAVPGIILLSPIIYLIFVALTVSMSGVVVVMVVLLLGLLIPHLYLMTTLNRWLLPSTTLLISLSFLIAGGFTAGFDANHPKPNSIFYGLNADTGTAIWASADKKPDEWTSQFLSNKFRKNVLTEYLPMESEQFLNSPAPVASLIPPKIKPISSDVSNGIRTIRMHITSPRQARVMNISVDSKTTVIATTVNGKQIKDKDFPTPNKSQKQWGLDYFAFPRKGIELTLKIEATQPLVLRAVDRTDELPQIPGKSFKPRPNYMMPTAFGAGVGNSTLVSKSFVLVGNSGSTEQKLKREAEKGFYEK
jgi:hypothetical protein